MLRLKKTIIAASLCLANICAVGIKMPTAAYVGKDEYDVYYEYIENFDELQENTEFSKKESSPVSNRYANTKFYLYETNNATIQNKHGNDKCLKISSGSAERIANVQYRILNKKFTSKYILLEQDVYIDSLAASFYLGHLINNVGIVTVTVQNDKTIKVNNVSVEGFDFNEKTWYNLKLYVNIETNKAMLYIDNSKITDWIELKSNSLQNTVLNNCQFNYTSNKKSGNDEVSICVDNIKTANLIYSGESDISDFDGIRAKIVNENGFEVKNTADIKKSACAEISIYNNNNVPKNGEIMIALYDGDALYKVKKSEISAEAYSDTQYKIEMSRNEIDEDFGEYTIKCFFWEENMKPVLAAEIKDNAEKYPMQIYVGEPEKSGEPAFDSIEAANEYIKQLKASGSYPQNGIDVNIRQGNFDLCKGIVINEQLSGEEGAPITYRAYKNEKVVFNGGVKLDKSDFTKVNDEVKNVLPQSAADKVMQYDLTKAGFTTESIGKLGYIGVATSNLSAHYSGIVKTVGASVYIGDEKLRLAQWPNEGYQTIGEVVDEGDVTRNWQDDKKGTSDYIPPEERPETPRGFTIKIPEEKAALWANTSCDARIYGYFSYNWYDGSDNIKQIDIESSTLTTQRDCCYGAKSTGRYIVYNMLEELDSPGEYYIDRENCILYAYLPESGDEITITAPSGDGMTIKASNINIENIDLEYGRNSGITLRDCNNVNIRNCRIAHFDKSAVLANNVENALVYGCDLYDLGDNAIFVSGGDLKTLIPSNNTIENNNIHDWGRISKSYSGAVRLSGVGGKIIHNKMYNAPHLAINLYGNDHLIAYNEIFDVLKDSGDAGAVYIGKSWIQRGITVRNNYFHDLKSECSGDIFGVYFDDFFCGGTVESNVFENVTGSYSAAFKGGGRDTTVKNNLIIECKALYRGVSMKHWFMSNTGLDAYKTYITNNWNSTSGYGLKSDVYDKEVYSKYPHIEDYDENDLINTINPKYSVMQDNVLYLTKIDRYWTQSGSYSAEEIESGSEWEFEDSDIYSNNPGFVDVLNRNYNLRKNNEIMKNNKDFKDIEFYKIGLYWE